MNSPKYHPSSAKSPATCIKKKWERSTLILKWYLVEFVHQWFDSNVKSYHNWSIYLPTKIIKLVMSYSVIDHTNRLSASAWLALKHAIDNRSRIITMFSPCHYQQLLTTEECDEATHERVLCIAGCQQPWLLGMNNKHYHQFMLI